MSRLMDERYGVTSTRDRRLLTAAVVLICSALLSWLVWAAWTHSTPSATGALRSFDVVSEHEVQVVIDVSRPAETEVQCTVRAHSDDQSIVGEEVVTIPSGGSTTVRFETALRTDRQARTVSVVACH